MPCELLEFSVHTAINEDSTVHFRFYPPCVIFILNI